MRGSQSSARPTIEVARPSYRYWVPLPGPSTTDNVTTALASASSTSPSSGHPACWFLVPRRRVATRWSPGAVQPFFQSPDRRHAGSLRNLIEQLGPGPDAGIDEVAQGINSDAVRQWVSAFADDGDQARLRGLAHKRLGPIGVAIPIVDQV